MKSSTQSFAGAGAAQSKPLIKSMKKVPSQLIKDQSSGKSIIEQFPKPKIIQFLNIGDNSIHTDSQVHVDEPLFAPIPHVIQFTNYEPLQTKQAVLTLRNKDRVARSVKIIPPDSKLFSVTPAKKSQVTSKKTASLNQSAASEIDQMSTKVAPGMDITYIVKFSPEAKSDYAYDLMVMTEREKFIVPIRARGCRAMLDFPDQLDFGLVPVKYETEKPVIIRNIGEKTTKWKITVPHNFRISQSEGILEVGQITQVVFLFVPQEARKYTEELTLQYDGLEAQIPVLGEAHNDNVYLSKSHIHTEPTSITLFSHQYYQIVNKSAVPIEFSWRAFATEMEEQQKKQRLNLQLSQEEQEEREEIEQAIDAGEDDDEDGDLDSDDSYDAAETQAKLERRKQRAVATLNRKYMSIRKAVEEDKMLFQDEIFQIEPLEGKIWPNTEMTCCVTFRPQGPYHYSCTAFANVTCNQERLALNLTGQGKGPQAQLSITEMDIGDIFVTNQKSFELGIENTGEIDCHWKLIPYETPFGSKFNFSKTDGTLGVREHVRDLLRVTFMSDILGEFSETFRFALEGSSEMLTLTFKGHVVAPTFKFSEDIIDFGKVSYKFPETKTVYLTNTSEVDINYVVRVPGDGRSLQNEFNIQNDRGRLAKDSRAEIIIEFIPCVPHVYDMVLVVDLEGVGQDMLAVPIKAECIVPKVRVQPNEFLQFDNCFLKHPKTKQIEIINDDNLRARFEIQPQDEQSKRVATYDVDMWNGVIEPHSTQVVNVKLQTEILGPVRTNFVVKLDGHNIPVMMLILASSGGPDVKLDKQELDFGQVEVLADRRQTFKITNVGQIDAEYTAFTKNKDSIWKVIERYGVIKAKEEKTITVSCIADEVQRFQDTLHIIVNNGMDVEVQLKAKGVGNTLYTKVPMNVIDFGTEYTYKQVPRQYFLENRGRKQMKIMWVRQNIKQKKKPADAPGAKSTTTDAGALMKRTGSISGENAKEEEQFVFSVVPDQITLGPKMGIMVEVRAYSHHIGQISEPWECQVLIGSERKPRAAIRSNITANFITPSLEFNNPKLEFKYEWEKGVPAQPKIEQLTIKNTGPLKTTLGLKIEPPFSCSVETLTLEKDAEDTVRVEFDPSSKQDRVSDTINGKLVISHEGHPHKDIVPLSGQVCFPNLQILPPKIDFGCILNDTGKKKYLVLTNISEMAVAYEWSFLEDAPNIDEQEEIDADNAGKKKKKKKKHLPINEVFDILPVSGILQPGQTENVEFTFYAGNGLAYNGMAVVSVDGGPDYDVPISGESNNVSFRLSSNSLDFGEVAYNESKPLDFYIENVGKVPFEFNINLSTLSRQGVIECSHMTGKVLAKERFKIQVKFFPGIPDNIKETFLVECGHFPAEKFTIKGVGIYPGCLLSFPRVNEVDFNDRCDRIKPMLEKGEIQYSALFHGNEAQKMLQPIPPKMVDKEKIKIDDPFTLDIAAEVDRQVLCEKIIDVYEDSAFRGTQASLGAGDAAAAQQMATSGALSTLDKNINIASYVCDFGNVIISKTARRSFRLTNTGKMKISFNFRKEALNAAGLDIEPDKVANLPQNASQFFNVVLTTRKTSKFGKARYQIPIDIKNGPKYTIEFIANVTIPELTLYPETLDFDRVCINTRKTVKIRLENNKEVPCDWSFSQKAEPSIIGQGTDRKNNDGERFQVWPHHGTLQPGQRQTVDVMFTPNADKAFTQKLAFKCQQNSNKMFILNVKGQGIHYQLEMIPETIKLGPVLPYDRSAIQEFEIRNPMDQPIEVYSLDFDRQYLEEEEILKRVDNFTANGSGEPLFLPLRRPGGEFWPAIRAQDDNKRKIESLKNEIKQTEQKMQENDQDEEKILEYLKKKEYREENPKDENGEDWPELVEPEKTQEEISETRNNLTTLKGELEAKLAEMLTDQLEVKMPPALKEDKKLNVILIGPEQSGRTTAANFLAQEHQRCLIRLDQLVDFWQKRGHAMGDEATKYLEDQEVKLQEAIAENEKKKKQKKGKKEEEEKFDAREYKYLPKELLQRMLAKRLSEDDCNAGAIFDNLECQYWPDQKFAIELICDTVPEQQVEVVLFTFNKEKMVTEQSADASAADVGDESNITEVCTNYRYARRNDPAHIPKDEDEKDKRDQQESPLAKKGGAKEKAAAKEAEEEKKLKEAEVARKKAEEQARAAYKPKEYSVEEKADWATQKQELEQFFSSIVMRQSNDAADAPAAEADGDQEKAAKDEAQPAADEAAGDQPADGKQDGEDGEDKEPKAKICYGKRMIREQNIQYDFIFLCEDIKKVVPEPEWPDPDNEPLPPPLINSIQKKPPARAQRAPITKFSIWTPIPEDQLPKPDEEENASNAAPEEGEAQEEDTGPKLPPMTDKQTRWVLEPQESKKLYVKFFSTKTGQQDQVLQFEIVGSYKNFNLNAKASCDFPMINPNSKNIYLNQKKSRPTTEPDSYLQKTFVISENCFDFGPLLIGKDPEKREEEDVKRVNGTFFRITNNGKYDLEASFVLKSTLPADEGGPTDKSPFIIEPAEAKLKVDETLNLQVFAFPEAAQLYKDEVICLIKDNPNPTILQIQCLGAQPIVNVDQEVVKFERALIGKQPKQEFVLTNACAIPVNWKLTGVDSLPGEFGVSKTSGLPKPPAPKKERQGANPTSRAGAKKQQEAQIERQDSMTSEQRAEKEKEKALEQLLLRTSGRLDPCKSETIEVSFNSLREQKFLETIKLEVEDVENHGIKQEEKQIQIDAEAFNISLNEGMTTELDFGAVRVGEPKELPLYLKNQGQYPISFDFRMKKAQTKQMFTITPMQGQLQPNEDININVKFMSKVEKKLTKSKQNSDITMIILEGEQQEEHQQIPILVSVEAVFSKFTISPLRNLNFGPMQFGNEMKRTFEIKNDGQFEFKYAICDFNNEEERAKIREERKAEQESRIAEKAEEKEEAKGKAAAKKPDPKAKAPKGKGDAAPDGTVVQVSQYSISPAIGSIAPDSSAVITVTFNAQGAKFYDSTICIDIANKDPSNLPDGIPFQLCAESSIPGINSTDFDQIFEEQTVIPSLDPSLNTQTVISSSLFSMQENVFWFGTMVASKNPEGTKERFKIVNPNKIPCTVKFAVKPRSQSKSEGFAFDVQPEGLTIDPHKHKYVTVGFNPSAMMQYSGVFEAIVDNGDMEDPTGKLCFELRGEGTLPTLQVEKPDQLEADGTPMLKFKKTRIGKDAILPIILKNEGQVAATARFDAITNEQFTFEGNMNQMITQKSYHGFDIRFKPTTTTVEKFLLTFSTMNNVFEQHKVWLIGEGFNENITFEGLPEDMEDELLIGDCIIGKAKAATFQMVNNGDKDVKFRWNSADKDEFRFYPTVGHLKAKSSKRIKVMVRGSQPQKFDKIDLTCECTNIEQTSGGQFSDWDDTMKTLRMVRPSEYRLIMKKREDEEKARKEAAEAAAAAAAGGKKAAGKPPPKKGAAADAPAEEEIVIDENEEPTEELIEVIPEPEHTENEESKKAVILKTSCVIDYAGYECTVTKVEFKPTLMYAQRTFKFTIKNTSQIDLKYNFKIANSMTGILDAGPYSIMPKKGSISPGCDDNFIVKFNPLEVESDMSRILSANILNLNPEQEPLIIECNGIAERPVIHFELPPTTYRERKEKDMAQVDSKYRIIEFESLGTNIKNTKRFMAVNPTNSGYEFEWEEIIDESNKQKPLFKCASQRGLILSGKKSEMVFEYTPDTVGEHESRWIFRIPSENITAHFLIVGRVNEPNVLLETSRVKFGPLLLQGKNKETIKIINQEHIPFAFNFTKESVRGNPDFGDSLKVTPMQGVVPADSDLPIEISFTPKFELKYNYNLCCNIKRKARPLILNVKGEGYKIHHSVQADEPRVDVVAGTPFNFDFGEFFINEKKTKQVILTNNGEFNFDFVWKRQVNKYIKITPETGTVQKGNEMTIDIDYAPISEHEMKNFKMMLTIVSGPKYDFVLCGKARKPGVKLNSNIFDFGSCFVTAQPAPIKKMLEITNNDAQAISLETDFEKKNYLDFPVIPGQVLMPGEENKIQIPIMFTPREIRKYQETIKLDFNGLYFVDLQVQGQGIPLNLDLKDPDHQTTDLGTVSVGGLATRVVPIINRSSKSVKFKIQPANQEAFNKLYLSISTNDKNEITLKPKETLPIEIKFKPKIRLPNFEQDIMIHIDGIEEARKLFTLRGTAHGIELKIMDEVLSFGQVVKDSRLSKTLQMSNFGDVKANFEWDTSKFSQNFTISPARGYVNPNSNLDLEVTFHPKYIDQSISQKVTCTVQGGEPINLTMMGKCVPQEGSETQELAFSTVVRKATVQNVQIQNTEDREWAINPTISTKSAQCQGYFTGKPTLVVPARGNANYEVTYLPKTMTKKEQIPDSEDMKDLPHEGSLFFPLPNGTALLYNLQGISTPPESEGTITETIMAKKQRNFIVQVKNWSKQTQRYSASWEVEGDSQPGLFIRGANTFDVAGESHKDYKLNFLALRAGVYKFKCTFLAKDTGEYLFYNFQVTVEENPEVETIELTSPIRESVAYQIIVENPTEQEVEVNRSQFSVQNEYVEIHPESLVLKPHESKDFQIRYLPLMISESEADMSLRNPVLGDFNYKLLLKGLAPTSQRSLAFKCALGQDQMQAFKFIHFLKKATNYAVKVERIDGPGACDFKADVAQVAAPAAENQKGVEVQLSIRYEPFTIGDSRGVLKLTSPEGMEYSCLLFGKSQAPQPQGPIKCAPGAKPIGVDFKNPLNEKCEFVVNFDNANFSLASKLPGPLDPGKVTNLQIKYEGKADLPNTGRMIVSTRGLPPWIFYLQGE